MFLPDGTIFAHDGTVVLLSHPVRHRSVDSSTSIKLNASPYFYQTPIITDMNGVYK